MAQGRILDKSDVRQVLLMDEGLDAIQCSNEVEKLRQLSEASTST